VRRISRCTAAWPSAEQLVPADLLGWVLISGQGLDVRQREPAEPAGRHAAVADGTPKFLD
jgi:hypothetical protein